jgi:hypothetical protein
VIWYILCAFGTLCVHLVHFVLIWYILCDLVHFVRIWNTLCAFGTLCVLLVQFVCIWYTLCAFGTLCVHLVHFSRFWYHFPRKIWQPWFTVALPVHGKQDFSCAGVNEKCTFAFDKCQSPSCISSVFKLPNFSSYILRRRKLNAILNASDRVCTEYHFC